MRKLLLITILLSFFSTFLTGCSHYISNGSSSTTWTNGIKNKDQFIVVSKHVGTENNFKEFRKIKVVKKVNKIKEILNGLKWVYAIRDTLQPPDYQFVYQPKDPKIKADAVLHRVWITPDKDRLVIVRGENQYAQLTKEQSLVLFEILTGDKLVK
ncbi:hypothetical protein HPT25_19905 [Bacillus sp. BRMEA1]|uniref:hypothetical protein n=1 Tax=Neobacillus endophyticus TaxID=2738405 RepID=UPI00156711F2|nr:hypothetical protein [Neobacillus endophyticus]NRD79629.1 hypothetical protein [Neobacillus endophyticus]